MIKKIQGLRRFTDCSMPTDEKGRTEKAECAAYNEAITDVIKLLNMHFVSKNEAVCQDETHECAVSTAGFCTLCQRLYLKAN